MRKGQKVRFDLVSLEKDAKEPNTALLRSLNDCPAMELLKRVREDENVTAKVDGSADYGSYIHLTFSDGFECGQPKENLILV